MKNTSAYSRRKFIGSASMLGLGTVTFGPALFAEIPGDSTVSNPLFRISLAQWSYNRSIREGKMNTLDFIAAARDTFGLDAVEYVSTLFRANPDSYWKTMKKVADDKNVKSLLIMVDDEGWLGDKDAAKRTESIERHKRWLNAARELGCHGIRVNANSSGSREEQAKLIVDGLSRLAEIAHAMQLNVMVENHGGLSSDGAWLADVMNRVNRRNCGTLPDFGNFWEYDRYKGMEELMPFALGVSAKSNDFDENGNETKTDFARMFRIVLNAGFRGYVDIEYEGGRFSEEEGIRKTLLLLRRIQSESLNWTFSA